MEDRVILSVLDVFGRPQGPYPESFRSIALILLLEKLEDGGVVGGCLGGSD